MLIKSVYVFPFWHHGDKLVDLKIIEKDEDHYLVENEKGEKIKLYMIKQEELDKIRRKENLKVVEKLHFKKLMRLIDMLVTIDESEIVIEHYEGTVTRLVEHLKACYDDVGRPNLFHHYIKNLDPIQYGRAQTFREETKSLLERVREIIELKNSLK